MIELVMNWDVYFEMLTNYNNIVESMVTATEIILSTLDKYK